MDVEHRVDGLFAQREPSSVEMMMMTVMMIMCGGIQTQSAATVIK